MMVFDVDGTLSFDGTSIAEDIVEALVAASHKHRIVFASARPLRDLAPIVPAAVSSAWLVGANGALRSGPSGVTSTHFSAETRARLDSIIAGHRLTHLIDGEWDYSYTGDGGDSVIAKVNRAGANNVPASSLGVYVKALVFAPTRETTRALHSLGLTVTEHSAEHVIDLAPTGIDKATGVAALAGHVPFIAFGNDANDVSLFRSAARSYCVGVHPAGQHATERIAPEEVARAIAEAATWLCGQRSQHNQPA